MKQKIHSAKRRLRIALILGVGTILILAMLIAIGIESLLNATGAISADKIDNFGLISMLIISAISIIIGSILAGFTSKLFLKPINAVIDGLQKLAQGNYETRLHFGKERSLIDVAKAFNTCAEELENTEMLRSDFINNFSHEFKTPIASINGFVKLLERGELSKEKEKKYLSIIREETERLADMTTNILTLTKIESQSILTEREEFYLSEQMRSCGLLLERKWKEKKLKLIFDFSEHKIVANEEMLKEVWINLLDNAIKYANKNSKLVVRIKEYGKNIYVEIENEGPEIPNDEKERIFQKFYQTSKKSSKSGNGIGLSIVKHIVDLHEGYVTVKCEEGKTIFAIALPKE